MRKAARFSSLIVALMLLLSVSGVSATPLAGTLTGRVTNSGGAGINGVQIYVANGIFGTTNSSGNYTIGNIPAGSGYNVVAFPAAGSGYANAHHYNTVISDGGTTTQNFTLSNSVGTLTGYVYNASTGARIAGVTLLLDSDVHDGWSNTAAATGSDGVYTMDRIAAGRAYYIHAFPPAPYTTVMLSIGTINAGSNSYNVPVSTSNSGINGHVSLPGGGSAVNASIFVGSADGGTGNCGLTTDGSGNYSCPLPPDTYFVHVLEFCGYPGLLTEAQLSSGYIAVNFTLNNGPQTINGQISDFELNPINNANVQAFEQAAPYGHFRSVFVGSNGRYNFTGMGNQGNYQMSGAATGYIQRVYDQVPIGGNPWTFNFKLGHFPDVPAYDLNNKIEFPFYYIEYLHAAGVINGFSDGTFQPTNNVRRGEYTKMLVAAAGWAIDTSGGPHFSDVPTSYVFYGYIETSYHHGAITGYGDGTYRPNSTISRAEATKVSVAVSGWALVNPPSPSYTDVGNTYWAYQFIETAHSHGANANDSGGFFRPNVAATRAETAKLVCVANKVGCGQ
jgi:hypothetical protein